MAYVSIPDYDATRGWHDPAQATQRARWCCERLEEGRILLLSALPFELSTANQQFLRSCQLGGARFHKNISYRPAQDTVRGVDAGGPAASERMHRVMRDYSRQVTAFLTRLLAPYAPHWTLDFASFRPEPEQERKLPLRKRNDLLHVDAFPNRPTRGGRILRCFTNIHPSLPRVWRTTEEFAMLANTYAVDAGLRGIAAGASTPFTAMAHSIKRLLGLNGKTASPYDKFMLRFHNYLKENSEFQANCPKTQIEFPPGSTWICFTDAVPHSVTYGQYALEQTLIVPVESMLTPHRAPLRVLESLAGRALVT